MCVCILTHLVLYIHLSVYSYVCIIHKHEATKKRPDARDTPPLFSAWPARYLHRPIGGRQLKGNRTCVCVDTRGLVLYVRARAQVRCSSVGLFFALADIVLASYMQPFFRR